MEAGAAGCRGPEAQLLQVHPQQLSGSERQAAAGAEEAPHVQHPGKQSGWGSLGGATLPGRGGLPAGLVPRDGLNACTDLLAAVAAVFEDTVAMLDAGLGREGHASDPGHSHYLPRALEWGKKCR